jgi:hypothetical protein
VGHFSETSFLNCLKCYYHIKSLGLDLMKERYYLKNLSNCFCREHLHFKHEKLDYTKAKAVKLVGILILWELECVGFSLMT